MASLLGAPLASTSRTALRGARPWSYGASRFLTTATSPPSPETLASSSALPGTPPPSTLPGSPLPEAYRTPTPLSTPTVPGATAIAPRRLQQTSFRDQSRPSSRFHQLYKLHVFSTRNNTILTLSTTPTSVSVEPSPQDPHHAVAWVSAGSAGYKGASRGTYDAAVEVSLRMFKKILELITPPVGSGGQIKKVVWPAPTELEIVWKGFGQGRDAVYRTLMGGEGDGVRELVRRVTDAVSGRRVVGNAWGSTSAELELLLLADTNQGRRHEGQEETSVSLSAYIFRVWETT